MEENADIPKCLLSDTSKPQIATFGGSHAFCGRRKLVKGQTKTLCEWGTHSHRVFLFPARWNRSVFCNPSLCLPVSDPPSFLGAFSFDGDKARQGRSNPLRCEDSGSFCRSPWQGKSGHSPQKKRRARSSRERSGSRRTAPIPYIFRRFPGNPGENRLVFFKQLTQHSPQGVIVRKSICLSIRLQSQPLADIHDKILYVGHNGFTPRLPRSRSLFTENSEISTL